MCWYASRLFSLLVLPLFLTFFLLVVHREHVQPLLTHTMGMMHEQVHCASWPSFSPIAPHHSLSATANVSSLPQFCRPRTSPDFGFGYLQYAANITYSVSTSTFLIMSSAVLSKQNVDVLIDGDESLRAVITEGGGRSMILDPEGRELVEKPAEDSETILYARLIFLFAKSLE